MRFLSISHLWIVAVLIVTVAFSTSSARGPDPAQHGQMVDKAVAFLRKQQAEDGSFSKEMSLGVTGVVVTGLLQSGRVEPNDPTVAKGLKFLESLVNTKEGHLAGDNPRVQLKNYVTSINVMAFAAADRNGKYKQIVDNASHFLTGLQWDEAEGKPRTNSFYGGEGYDSKSRPDLSNTQFFLDALKAAGLPKDDPAFKRAVVFVSRCQNLKSEFNDQPWAGKVNDGSFIYTAAGDGETKVLDKPPTSPDEALPGYGSMTYAGIKSLIYAGVDKKDPRVQTALEWIRKNYTVDENPGLPKARSHQGYYYYLHTMAKCLHALGEDTITDDKGVRHDWRKDISEALMKRQRPDGSWLNETDRWMEGDPNLVTGYCLMTLGYCKGK